MSRLDSVDERYVVRGLGVELCNFFEFLDIRDSSLFEIIFVPECSLTADYNRTKRQKSFLNLFQDLEEFVFARFSDHGNNDQSGIRRLQATRITSIPESVPK